MSVSKLVIDVDTLQLMANSIRDYTAGAYENLDAAIRGIQQAQGEWHDDDMVQLQESLIQFYAGVNDLGKKGTDLISRCEQKIKALEQLHNIKI